MHCRRLVRVDKLVLQTVNVSWPYKIMKLLEKANIYELHFGANKVAERALLIGPSNVSLSSCVSPPLGSVGNGKGKRGNPATMLTEMRFLVYLLGRGRKQ